MCKLPVGLGAKRTRTFSGTVEPFEVRRGYARRACAPRSRARRARRGRARATRVVRRSCARACSPRAVLFPAVMQYSRDMHSANERSSEGSERARENVAAPTRDILKRAPKVLLHE